MSELIRDPLIVSIAEVRKTVKQAGFNIDHIPDEDLEKYISELDYLALLFLESVVASKEAAYKKED